MRLNLLYFLVVAALEQRFGMEHSTAPPSRKPGIKQGLPKRDFTLDTVVNLGTPALFTPDIQFQEEDSDLRIIITPGSRYPHRLNDYNYSIDSIHNIVYFWSTINVMDQVKVFHDKFGRKPVKEVEGCNYNVIRYCEQVNGFCKKIGKIYTEFEIIHHVYPLETKPNDEAFILVRGHMNETVKKNSFTPKMMSHYSCSFDFILVPPLFPSKEEDAYNSEEERIYSSDKEDDRRKYSNNYEDYYQTQDDSDEDAKLYFDYFGKKGDRNQGDNIFDDAMGQQSVAIIEKQEGEDDYLHEDNAKILGARTGTTKYRSGKKTFKDVMEYMHAEGQQTSSDDDSKVERRKESEVENNEGVGRYSQFTPLDTTLLPDFEVSNSDAIISNEKNRKKKYPLHAEEAEYNSEKLQYQSHRQFDESKNRLNADMEEADLQPHHRHGLALNLNLIRAVSKQTKMTAREKQLPKTPNVIDRPHPDDIPELCASITRLHVKYEPDMIFVEGPFLWLLEVNGQKCFMHRHYLPLLTEDEEEISGVSMDHKRSLVFKVPYFENQCLLIRDGLFFSFDIRDGNFTIYRLKTSPGKQSAIEFLFVVTNLPFRKFWDSRVEVFFMIESSKNFIYGPDQWVFIVKEDFSIHLLVIAKSIVSNKVFPEERVKPIDFSHSFKFGSDIQWVDLILKADLKPNMQFCDMESRAGILVSKPIITSSGTLRLPFFVEPSYLGEVKFRQSLLVIEILKGQPLGPFEQRLFYIDTPRTEIFGSKLIFNDQKVFFLTEEPSSISKRHNPAITLKSRHVMEKKGIAGLAWIRTVGSPTPMVSHDCREEEGERGQDEEGGLQEYIVEKDPMQQPSTLSRCWQGILGVCFGGGNNTGATTTVDLNEITLKK